jgi:hypothetical protein
MSLHVWQAADAGCDVLCRGVLGALMMLCFNVMCVGDDV